MPRGRGRSAGAECRSAGGPRTGLLCSVPIGPGPAGPPGPGGASPHPVEHRPAAPILHDLPGGNRRPGGRRRRRRRPARRRVRPAPDPPPYPGRARSGRRTTLTAPLSWLPCPRAHGRQVRAPSTAPRNEEVRLPGPSVRGDATGGGRGRAALVSARQHAGNVGRRARHRAADVNSAPRQGGWHRARGVTANDGKSVLRHEATVLARAGRGRTGLTPRCGAALLASGKRRLNGVTFAGVGRWRCCRSQEPRERTGHVP